MKHPCFLPQVLRYCSRNVCNLPNNPVSFPRYEDITLETKVLDCFGHYSTIRKLHEIFINFTAKIQLTYANRRKQGKTLASLIVRRCCGSGRLQATSSPGALQKREKNTGSAGLDGNPTTPRVLRSTIPQLNGHRAQKGSDAWGRGKVFRRAGQLPHKLVLTFDSVDKIF